MIRRYKINGRYDDGECKDGEYCMYSDVKNLEDTAVFMQGKIEQLEKMIRIHEEYIELLERKR